MRTTFLALALFAIAFPSGAFANGALAQVPVSSETPAPDTTGWAWAGGTFGLSLGFIGTPFLLNEARETDGAGYRTLLTAGALLLPAALSVAGGFGLEALADSGWNEDSGFHLAHFGGYAIVGAALGYSAASVFEADSVAKGIGSATTGIVLGTLAATLDALLLADAAQGNRMGPVWSAAAGFLLVALPTALVAGIAELPNARDPVLFASSLGGLVLGGLMYALL